MKKFRVVDVIGNFGIFLDDEIEADGDWEAKNIICNEIMDNLGNYIDIELEEIESEEDEFDEYQAYEDNKLEEEYIEINY